MEADMPTYGRNLNFNTNCQITYAKTPHSHEGPLILFSKITVPGIGRLSNFLIDDFLDYTG